MSTLRQLASLIEGLNRFIGRVVMWLLLAMVLVQFTIVILRHVFAIGSIPLQESVWTLNGLAFMLAAGYVAFRDGHVRVDVVYREAGNRTRAAIDLLGCLLLLLPLCIFTFWMSMPYVASSWRVLEGSREVGGLPGLFLFKTVIPVFAVLLGLQAVALAVRAADRLAADEDGSATP